MAHVEDRFKIETDEICILCTHIRGVCRCETPSLMKIADWLMLDQFGQRMHLKKGT